MSNERYKKGMDEMKRHLGADTEKYVESIREIAPLFARVNVEFAFGDLYGDPECPLDQKTRELITIGALTVLGYAIPELKIHVKAALLCGASKEEIVAVITQMLAYCGFPAATNALMVAKEIFEEA